MIEKPLPNGWTLLLSAEVYRDPQGQNYEVRGLPPRVKREIFPADDLTGGHARAVLALMDEIRRGAISLLVDSKSLLRNSASENRPSGRPVRHRIRLERSEAAQKNGVYAL